MNFETYLEEMHRLGWQDDEMQSDFALHEREIKSGQELPWFPAPRPKGEETKMKPEGNKR